MALIEVKNLTKTYINPSTKFGLFFMPPRLGWRDRVGGIFRKFSLNPGKQKRLPARHMPLHKVRDDLNSCQDFGLPDNPVYRRVAGGSKFSVGVKPSFKTICNL